MEKHKVSVIYVSRMISNDLALRNSADQLFERIERLPNKHVSISFENVTTITRSFAHQYTIRKSNSTKDVREIQVPRNVKQMFDIVKDNDSRSSTSSSSCPTIMHLSAESLGL